MVQGLKFLSKKGFHPKNMANQKRVWEREQQTKQEASLLAERQKTLERERDDAELRKSRGDIKLEFMYHAPPGIEDKKKNHDAASAKSSAGVDLTLRQPGDDDAAAAFRQFLASGSASAKEKSNQPEDFKSSFTSVLHGSNVDTALPDRKSLSALEQAVGRKKSDAPTTTLDEQLERFPALKNAPRVRGTAGDTSAVQFKPLGAQIRNVRCLTCGVWGHSRGDRECEVSGWDPFSSNNKTSQAPPSGSVGNSVAEGAPGEGNDRGEKRASRRDTSLDSDSSESRHRRKERRRKHGRKKKSKKSKCSSRDRKRRRDRSPSSERAQKRKSRDY